MMGDDLIPAGSDHGDFLITDEMLDTIGIRDMDKFQTYLLAEAQRRGLQLMVEDGFMTRGKHVYWRPDKRG